MSFKRPSIIKQHSPRLDTNNFICWNVLNKDHFKKIITWPANSKVQIPVVLSYNMANALFQSEQWTTLCATPWYSSPSVCSSICSKLKTNQTLKYDGIVFKLFQSEKPETMNKFVCHSVIFFLFCMAINILRVESTWNETSVLMKKYNRLKVFFFFMLTLIHLYQKLTVIYLDLYDTEFPFYKSRYITVNFWWAYIWTKVHVHF